MSDVLLLTSGGLDSTTLAYWLVERGVAFLPVFLDYGQHCVETEWQTLQEVLPPGTRTPYRLGISDVFGNSRSRLIAEADLWTEQVADTDLYVPYRTVLFFAVAASRAQTLGMSEVYSGFINSNHAKELDCSAEFMNGLEAFTQDVGPVRFHMPFRYWSKTQVVSEAVRLGVPIGKTFSCQLLSDVPCGACPNCVERLDAIDTVRRAVAGG